jgi:hypothetical protein
MVEGLFGLLLVAELVGTADISVGTEKPGLPVNPTSDEELLPPPPPQAHRPELKSSEIEAYAIIFFIFLSFGLRFLKRIDSFLSRRKKGPFSFQKWAANGKHRCITSLF